MFNRTHVPPVRVTWKSKKLLAITSAGPDALTAQAVILDEALAGYLDGVLDEYDLLCGTEGAVEAANDLRQITIPGSADRKRVDRAAAEMEALIVQARDVMVVDGRFAELFLRQ